MTTTTDRSISSFHRRLAILAFAGLAIAAGCDDSGASRQITSAQAKLLSVTAGGVSAPAESRRKTYQAVVSELQGASGDFDGVALETASSLMGEAQTGLAQIELAEALVPASDLATLLTSARIAAAEFASQSAIAAVMRSGDSGADLDRIAGESERVAQEMEESRLNREGLVGQVAQLNARQQEQREQATTIRQQEAALRQQAIRASAAERAELTEQAYRLARRAAEFERAASDLQAQADVLLPEVRNAEIREQQLNTLGAQLRATRQSIEDERARRLEDSNTAQRVADEAGARVEELLGQIEIALENEFQPAVSEAISAYERAVGTLRRAKNGLAMSAAQQGLGDAHRLRSTTLGQVLSTMNHIASMDAAPTMTDLASDLAATLDEAIAQADEAAAQAYADAASSLRTGAARVSGDTRERVNQAVETLEALAASIRGEETAPVEENIDDTSINDG
jgi:DNA repair exonuclease SbcCD ATPase subunit